jgi:hypothetical protein
VRIQEALHRSFVEKCDLAIVMSIVGVGILESVVPLVHAAGVLAPLARVDPGLRQRAGRQMTIVDLDPTIGD